MADRVLELRNQIENRMMAFDAALECSDQASASAHVGWAQFYSELYDAAIPDTREGAADKIRNAIVTLNVSDDFLSHYCTRQLNPIAKRLARGNSTLADIISLRAIVDIAQGRMAEDDVMPSLRTALQAVSRPTLVKQSAVA